VEFGGQEGRSTRSRFGIELLLRTRSLQTVHWPSVYDLVHRFGEAVALAHTNVGHTAVVRRGNVRTDHVVGAFAPRIFDHVSVGRDGRPPLGEAAVRGVLLVLQSGFLVRPRLLPLASLFQADDHADRDQCHQRYERGDRRDDDDVLRRQVRFGGHPRTRRRARRHFLALAALEAGRAETLEPGDALHASASVLARFELAFVYFFAAVFSCETGRALALVIVDQLQASPAVGAGLGDAIVYAVLAQGPHVSRHALAPELVDFVHAGAPVLAGVAQAVVDVDLAAFAAEARRADALESAGALHAGPVVLARIRRATVDLVLALGAPVSGLALAPVAGIGVRAGTAV
jgi:hypothetical protein